MTTKIVTPKAAPAKEVEKDASMVKQKEMMAAHYDRLTSAPRDRREGRAPPSCRAISTS